MQANAGQERMSGGPSTRESHRDAAGSSDLDDSLLQGMRLDKPAHRLPARGEWLGGEDGRRYEVLEWMGGGSMGQVFRAHDVVLQREVALKFLLPHLGCAEAALQEARAIARLDHENIVRIFDVAEWSGTEDGPRVPFLVMECLEGEPLSTRMNHGPLEVWRALELLDAIAAGLAHAHERGLVHRDLKPGNIFLTWQGPVKVLDFGLSHLPSRLPPAHGSRLPVAGTPAYMAPEQWRGEPQGPHTDVWAAGVVLHELLTGRRPWSGTSDEALREQILSTEPLHSVRAHVPGMPPELEALLATALERDPARRFPSARELREELRELSARYRRPERAVRRPTVPQFRQVTLLSCQLTVHAAGGPLDLEDEGERELVFQQVCAEFLQQRGGTIVLALGSEVLACFGWPQAREDATELAVRAGLQVGRELREALQRALPHLCSSGVSARTGILTDTVGLGERPSGTRGGSLVLQGEAPRRAAWLAAQAAPGEVLVGETTWKLVGGAFEADALGPHAFPGRRGTATLEVHRVLREKPRAVRFEGTSAAEGLTPLVGREHELQRLLGLWEQARSGQGTAVCVSGEAGIGKSRLIQELCERIPAEEALVLRIQCRDAFRSTPLHPVLEILQHLGFDRAEGGAWPSGQHPLERLRALDLSEVHAHVLGTLLDIPLPEGSPAALLTPRRRREATIEALVHLLLNTARRQPILIVVEDMHWAEHCRLELLGALLEGIARTHALVVLSTRPEFRPPWSWPAGFHRLVLEHLPEPLAATLVRESARGRRLPEQTVQALVRRTDGIPLFIEEMTRMVVDQLSTAPEAPPRSIPVTLHGLLLARLDMLPSRQKELAQRCAVMGRDFTHALVLAISERDEATLRRELAGLMGAGLVQERPGDEPGYQFRHALIQEAAYQSLPKGARRELHRHIAGVLEEHFPALVQARPELLAHHATEAGDTLRALRFWLLAGQVATRRVSGPQAVSHLTRALELLRGLPDADQRLAEELWIRSLLSIPLTHQQGYFAPEVERMFARIRELSPQVADALPRPALSFLGLYSFYRARGEFRLAGEQAERLLALGERREERGLKLQGLGMMLSMLLAEGRPGEALKYFERVRAFPKLTLDEHRALAEEQWIDPMTTALGDGSIVHAMLGQPREARRCRQEALSLAGRIGHPYTSAYALTSATLTSVLLRDVSEALARADQVIALSSERDFPLWHSWATIVRGWALGEQGDPDEGVALVLREFERWKHAGMRGTAAHNPSLLAKLYLRLGRVPEAMDLVLGALRQMERTGERSMEAELHRVHGECLGRLGQWEDAHRCFLRALAVARVQQAVIFELRASVSLGHLSLRFGQPAEARRILEEARGRFDPDEDMPDLQEARGLLAELGRRP